ncbi:MAG: Veg family protein [Bacilli bacterium]
MSFLDIKDQIAKSVGKKVRLTVYGMRNRKDVICGVIKYVYPNIFTVVSKDISKSFSYSDVLIGDVKIEYI